MQFNVKKTERNFAVIVIVFAWLHLIVFCFTLSQTYFEWRPRAGVGRSVCRYVPFVTPNVKWGYVFCVFVCVCVSGVAGRLACRRGGKMIYNFIPFDLCTFIEMCWQVSLESMPDGIMGRADGWTCGHSLVAVTSPANPTHALRLNLISLASEKSKLASPARTRFAA